MFIGRSGQPILQLRSEERNSDSDLTTPVTFRSSERSARSGLLGYTLVYKHFTPNGVRTRSPPSYNRRR